MTTRRALAVLLALAPFVAGAASSPQAASNTPPTQLLRVHLDFNFGGHGLTFKEEDLFVTNRLVTSVIATSVLAAPPPFNSWTPQGSTRVARQRLLANLLQSLAANGVESQTGDCSVHFPVAPAAGRYELTWYDGPRRGGFTVEIGPTTTCPPEVPRIINSINQFALASGLKGFGLPVDEP